MKVALGKISTTSSAADARAVAVGQPRENLPVAVSHE